MKLNSTEMGLKYNLVSGVFAALGASCGKFAFLNTRSTNSQSRLRLPLTHRAAPPTCSERSVYSRDDPGECAHDALLRAEYA